MTEQYFGPTWKDYKKKLAQIITDGPQPKEMRKK